MNIESQNAEQIRRTVKAYVEGMTFVDEAAMRGAFHPDCKIIGHYEGLLEWLSLEDFVDSIKAGNPSAELIPPKWEIVSLDVTGDAASVKVNDEFIGMKFTDYLSLLKISGAWVIVNKLYYLNAN